MGKGLLLTRGIWQFGKIGLVPAATLSIYLASGQALRTKPEKNRGAMRVNSIVNILSINH